MHTFKDKLSREWTLEATFGAYARVKAQTGVKLYDIATESRESLVALADAFTLGSVLWSMIEPQAASRGITPEQFYDAVDGTVLTDAYQALIDEMIFFCHPRQRKMLAAAVDRIRIAEKRAETEMDQMLPELEAEIDRAISAWIRGGSGLSLQDSLEFTQESGRCENLSTQPLGGVENNGTTHAPSLPS